MMLFEAVKQGVPIEDAAQRYGLEINRQGKCVCPFHKDHDPSMKIYSETNSFYCFGCHVSGSVIDLIAQITKADSKNTALELAKEYNIPFDGQPRETYISAKPKPTPAAKQYADDLKHFTRIVIAYLKLLEQWQVEFAPKVPGEEINPLWLEAVEKYDMISELADTLLFGDPVERASAIIELKGDLEQYEKRVREFAA